MLADESGDDRTRVELQEATFSGHPLGEALVLRLEQELGRRLQRESREASQAGSRSGAGFFLRRISVRGRCPGISPDLPLPKKTKTSQNKCYTNH